MKKSNAYKMLKAAIATTVATGAFVAAVPTFTQAVETTVPSFSDVKDISTHYFYEGVMNLAEREVISGYADGTFRPYQNISRAHAAKIMALALELDIVNVKDPGFTDVSQTNPYYGHIAALVEAGIISGYEDNTFKPSANLTRAQMAKIIVLGYDLKEAKLTEFPFKDIKTKDWHAEFIRTLYSNEITTGTTATTFSPNTLVTRGQMATFINRSELANKDLMAIRAVAKQVNSGIINVARGSYASTENKLAAVQSNIHNISAERGVLSKVVAGPIEDTYVISFTKGEEAMEKTIAVTFDFAPGDRFVAEVMSINATQVKVAFSAKIDPASLFTNGKSGALKANVTLSSLDKVTVGALTGELSGDGKFLIITSKEVLLKRYDVLIDGVKAIDGTAIDKYDEMITIAADKTAPQIISVERISASQTKVKFSEPMKAFANVSFKYADGSAVTGVSGRIAAGADEVVFTMASNVLANKDIVATFIGAQDQVGNLITPNPAMISFSKGSPDGVAPTVSSYTQTGATTFAVRFSEELVSAPNVKVGQVNATTVVKDDSNPEVYIVTAARVLDGATVVEVSSFTDLSGEVGKPTSQVVAFVKDVDAPKMVASVVVQDATDGKEYLELIFDKNIKIDADSKISGSGTFVKDYVTSPTTNFTATKATRKDDHNKNIVRVELDAFLGGATTDIKGVTYTLDLGFVKLTSDTDILPAPAKVTFTRGEDAAPSNTIVVGITNVAQDVDDTNKVNVTFNNAVDGASAINPANYRVDGAIVESVTLRQAVTAGIPYQVAVLNLVPDSNIFSGTRNITIENVKALGSTKTMEPYFTDTVLLKENVAPTVTSAKLTDTREITLTFSESVHTKAGTTDFALLIGGATVASNDTITTTVGTNVTTVVLRLESNVSPQNIRSGLSLVGLATLNIKDAAGNNLSVPATILVRE
ncbi:S-layer homology domain-containing protein [Sporosarcina sp. FA9]|uniref:S-layer homology domain-containing protein n=1 Tax=Sporosarcina sp. FA9 TaxID=3413030 RepID=UPI003F6568BA